MHVQQARLATLQSQLVVKQSELAVEADACGPDSTGSNMVELKLAIAGKEEEVHSFCTRHFLYAAPLRWPHCRMLTQIFIYSHNGKMT